MEIRSLRYLVRRIDRAVLQQLALLHVNGVLTRQTEFQRTESRSLHQGIGGRAADLSISESPPLAALWIARAAH
jgi:hypothetical protein